MARALVLALSALPVIFTIAVPFVTRQLDVLSRALLVPGGLLMGLFALLVLLPLVEGPPGRP